MLIMKLSEFVTENFHYSTLFVSHHLSTWKKNEVYLKLRKMLLNLKQVNNTVKCGISFIKCFDFVL